jgi:hypothetical protein
MAEVGLNTGNLMFRHAISCQVGDSLVPCAFDNAVEIASRLQIDAVVVAAANWLCASSHNNNGPRAKVLRQLNLPIICIGLGCQHFRPTMEKLEFPVETKNLLETLSDLQAFVLVRDETTFAQCRHYSLKNVFLVGCPSNFINHSVNFCDVLVNNSLKNSYEKISLNAGLFHGLTLEHDLKLLPLVKQTGGQYVIQSNYRNIASIALGRPAECSVKDLNYYRKAYKIKRSFRKLNQDFEKFKGLLHIYFDVPEWISNASSWDIVLGCRIHGAMAAIQAGVPAILTTIDSRTQGLADLMKIPHVHLNDTNKWKKNITIKDITSQVVVDYTEYLSKRSELMCYYADIVEKFGLTLSESFRSIVWHTKKNRSVN